MENQWQPMDTAPRDRLILMKDSCGEVDIVAWGSVFSGRGHRLKGWCIKGSESDEFGESATVDDPIGWMPLPE